MKVMPVLGAKPHFESGVEKAMTVVGLDHILPTEMEASLESEDASS